MNACFERFARSSLLAGVALLGGISAPVPASAQSAEESVAFMLWGLQDGSNAKRVSPTLWKVEHESGERSTIGIVRVTDCLFRVFSKVQRAGILDVLEIDYLLDFAAVDDYSAWLANGHDQRIIVKIEGQGWYSKTARNATGRIVYSITAGSVDAYVADGSVERLLSAFSYFRSAFCRGRS